MEELLQKTRPDTDSCALRSRQQKSEGSEARRTINCSIEIRIWSSGNRRHEGLRASTECDDIKTPCASADWSPRSVVWNAAFSKPRSSPTSRIKLRKVRVLRMGKRRLRGSVCEIFKLLTAWRVWSFGHTPYKCYAPVQILPESTRLIGLFHT